MKDSSYSNTWTDTLGEKSKSIEFQRNYQSRSVYDGWLGIGWCLNWEYKLHVNDDGNVSLQHCHEIETYNLKDKSIPLKFYSSSNPGHLLSLQDGIFKLNMKNKGELHFDHKGNLVLHINKKGRKTRLFYSHKGLPFALSNDKGTKVKVTYANSRIIQLKASPFQSLNFTYANGNLVQITHSGKIINKFTYDGFHNLTSHTNQNKAEETIKYDSHLDRVLVWKRLDNCREEYTYQSQTDDPVNHFVTLVKTKCPKQRASTRRLEFWHKKNRDNLKYLARIKQEAGGKIKDIYLHPQFGTPIRIQEGSKLSTFTYDSEGRLIRHRVNGREFRFAYNNQGHVKTIHIDKSSHFLFQYDQQGRLTQIKSEKVEDHLFNPRDDNNPNSAAANPHIAKSLLALLGIAAGSRIFQDGKGGS